MKEELVQNAVEVQRITPTIVMIKVLMGGMAFPVV